MIQLRNQRYWKYSKHWLLCKNMYYHRISYINEANLCKRKRSLFDLVNAFFDANTSISIKLNGYYLFYVYLYTCALYVCNEEKILSVDNLNYLQSTLTFVGIAFHFVQQSWRCLMHKFSIQSTFFSWNLPIFEYLLQINEISFW